LVQVSKGISGVPVTDKDGKLLGEVSGFDIIALDKTPGRVDTTDGMFPKIGRCEEYNGDVGKMWGNFLELQQIAAQANSSTVGQIMNNALSIPQDTTLEDAAWCVPSPRLASLLQLTPGEGRVGCARGCSLR
jgi:CBS domain-containing protein